MELSYREWILLITSRLEELTHFSGGTTEGFLKQVNAFDDAVQGYKDHVAKMVKGSQHVGPLLVEGGK